MPRRAAAFTQSDMTRALKAAQAAGLDVARVEVQPDGTINVVMASANENREPGGPAAFDQWRAKRGTREA